jgi:hypothetical protein
MTVPPPDRRLFLSSLEAMLMAPSISSAQPASWRSQPPEAAGFAPDLSARLDGLIEEKRVWNVHAVLVARHGKLLLERYFSGTDHARGRSLGTVTFGPDTLHDLRSVSKSIVGLLYGLALSQGKVPPPEASLLSSFPAYADLAGDPARAVDGPSRAHDAHGHGLGRARRALYRSDQQ